MGWLAGLFSLHSSFSLPLCADYIESASTFSCCFEPWDVSLSYIAIKNALDLMYNFACHLSELCMCFYQELQHCSTNLMQFSLEATYIYNKYMEYSKIYSLPPFYSAHLGNTFLHISWTVHNIRLLLCNISGNCFTVLPAHIELFLLPQNPCLISVISVSAILSTWQYFSTRLG